MSRPARIAPACAVVACLALAAAAPGLGARISPGVAIGPAALDLERVVLEVRVGPGVVVARVPDPQRPRTRNLDRVVVAYARARVTVTFPTDEASSGATRVATRSPVHRLASGAGVGTTLRALRAAHPRVVCTASACRLGRDLVGAPVIRFTLAAGRVARVEVFRTPTAR